MMTRAWPILAVMLIGVAVPAAAQPQSAQQNVRESREYEQLLCTNPAFRAKRIAQECGPLEGSQFYHSCVASFACGAPHRYHGGPPPSETTR
jgi:hypothetical protein